MVEGLVEKNEAGREGEGGGGGGRGQRRGWEGLVDQGLVGEMKGFALVGWEGCRMAGQSKDEEDKVQSR